MGRAGTLHAAWWSLAFDEGKTIFQRGPDDDPLPLIYGRSTDHGRTWTRTDIDSANQEYTRHPVIVADPGSNWVYVLWYGNAEARNLPLKFDDRDHSDVFLRASDDGGRTWGPRKAVNDDAGKGVNHAHPNLSVAAGAVSTWRGTTTGTARGRRSTWAATPASRTCTTPRPTTTAGRSPPAPGSATGGGRGGRQRRLRVAPPVRRSPVRAGARHRSRIGLRRRVEAPGA